MAMTELTIIPLTEPTDIKVFQEYEDDKKKFLERNANRFFVAYKITGSKKLQRIYQALLQERQKC